METELSIQQVASRTGLSIDTLRYYERIGLLVSIHRASSGHRRYNQKDLEYIELLIRLRATGMPLAQMIRFAQLRRQGDATAAERLCILEEHQRALEERVQQLQGHMAALRQKIAQKKASLAQQEAASHHAGLPDQQTEEAEDHAPALSEQSTR